MDKSRNRPREDPAEGASEIVDREVDRAEKKADQRLKEEDERVGQQTVEPDDLPNFKAVKEAAREHADAYIVESDLEDDEQRSASPGSREQN